MICMQESAEMVACGLAWYTQQITHTYLSWRTLLVPSATPLLAGWGLNLCLEVCYYSWSRPPSHWHCRPGKMRSSRISYFFVLTWVYYCKERFLLQLNCCCCPLFSPSTLLVLLALYNSESRSMGESPRPKEPSVMAIGDGLRASYQTATRFFLFSMCLSLFRAK